MSSLRRRPRLRGPCLPAVNRFHFAQDTWLDRLVVAGAAGRSCPQAPEVLGAAEWCDGYNVCRNIYSYLFPRYLNNNENLEVKGGQFIYCHILKTKQEFPLGFLALEMRIFSRKRIIRIPSGLECLVLS